MKSFADAQAAGSGSHEGSDGTSALPLRLAVTAFTWRAYLLRDERAPVVMSALYDQAAALHMLVRATTDEEEKMAAAKAAITALRRALEKDSSDERLWNALGVLCAEAGKAVAQHAFVVSLDLYTKVRLDSRRVPMHMSCNGAYGDKRDINADAPRRTPSPGPISATYIYS